MQKAKQTQLWRWADEGFLMTQDIAGTGTEGSARQNNIWHCPKPPPVVLLPDSTTAKLLPDFGNGTMYVKGQNN